MSHGKYEKWECPICGYKTDLWQDGLHHIVKQHIEEYAETFYQSKLRRTRLME